MSAKKTPASLEALESRLLHHFSNRALLVEALTHASSTDNSEAPDYQRLEFLGDRVLGLLASEALMQRYPSIKEGGLAVRLNALVRKETCAEIGESLGLGDYFRLAKSEDQAGMRQSTTLLADICEAVLGALYLDGGLEAARRFFLAEWGKRIGQLDVVRRDPKTALQEWAQGEGLEKPQYDEIGRSGPDHAPVFQIEVSVDGLATARGEGSNKRAAEKAAAKTMLLREGIWASPNQGRQ